MNTNDNFSQNIEERLHDYAIGQGMVGSRTETGNCMSYRYNGKVIFQIQDGKYKNRDFVLQYGHIRKWETPSIRQAIVRLQEDLLLNGIPFDDSNHPYFPSISLDRLAEGNSFELFQRYFTVFIRNL